MLNVGALIKLAKGATDPEALKPALKAMGFDLDMKPVELDDAPAALRHLAVQAGRRGASLHRLSGTMKDGGTIEAFIVLVPHVEIRPNSHESVIVQNSPKAVLSPA